MCHFGAGNRNSITDSAYVYGSCYYYLGYGGTDANTWSQWGANPAYQYPPPAGYDPESVQAYCGDLPGVGVALGGAPSDVSAGAYGGGSELVVLLSDSGFKCDLNKTYDTMYEVTYARGGWDYVDQGGLGHVFNGSDLGGGGAYGGGGWDGGGGGGGWDWGSGGGGGGGGNWGSSGGGGGGGGGGGSACGGGGGGGGD